MLLLIEHQRSSTALAFTTQLAAADKGSQYWRHRDMRMEHPAASALTYGTVIRAAIERARSLGGVQDALDVIGRELTHARTFPSEHHRVGYLTAIHAELTEMRAIACTEPK